MVEHLLDFIATLNPDMIAYTGITLPFLDLGCGPFIATFRSLQLAQHWSSVGDSPRGGTWKETFDSQRGISKWVADAIAEHIPGVPAYATFGNHGKSDHFTFSCFIENNRRQQNDTLQLSIDI